MQLLLDKWNNTWELIYLDRKIDLDYRFECATHKLYSFLYQFQESANLSTFFSLGIYFSIRVLTVREAHLYCVSSRRILNISIVKYMGDFLKLPARFTPSFSVSKYTVKGGNTDKEFAKQLAGLWAICIPDEWRMNFSRLFARVFPVIV